MTPATSLVVRLRGALDILDDLVNLPVVEVRELQIVPGHPSREATTVLESNAHVFPATPIARNPGIPNGEFPFYIWSDVISLDSSRRKKDLLV